MAAKAQAKPPSGTRDFLPYDLARRTFVTQVIRDVYEAHGFAPLETPTFERLDTLLGKYGDEGDQLVFKVLHRGQNLVTGIRRAHEYIQEPGVVVTGRSGETAAGAERILADLGLRYDLTVPLARAYAAYQGKLPPIFRRYQIQPVWRADSPGKGRFREFYQCDVDVIGAQSLSAEAEVAGAVSSVLWRLGFSDCVIRLNDRRILQGVVEGSGIPKELETTAIVALDKLDKISEAEVVEEMASKGVAQDAAGRMMSIVLGDVSLDTVEAALQGHEA
ncbi:MAG: ATP phosphoribosyltransferase regulatory subunit, partial [Myxococcales bacterium]|nr:ATP phosphoribosyltransferase regulatory subunit [Myxococcales bacterium]